MRCAKKNPQNVLLRGARRRSREAGILCDLTVADVLCVWADGRCTYCDKEVRSGGWRGDSPSLDRLLPERGYTKGNTVLACVRCNAIKADSTPESLRTLATKIEEIIHRQNPTETKLQAVVTRHEFFLHDEHERNAYNQFINMIERYRNTNWVQSQAVSEPAAVPDATGDATPAEEAQVIGHIEPELTYAEVLAKLQAFVATHDTKQGRALLDAFKINRLGDLPKERYKEFAAACDAVLVTA